jgi:Putative MetA-pathway of phenol degradation
MKLVTLVLVILSPIVVAAQGKDPFQLKNQSEMVAMAQPNVSTEMEVDEDASGLTDWSANQPSYPGPNDQQQANANPSPPTPPPAETRQRIPGSMVGYIDNPIVQNQVRIRFDAAFEDQFPDRSEFFYAKCGCYTHLNIPQFANIPLSKAYDPNAPGPGLGVPNSINFQQLFMNVEYSPHRRFSAFVEIPIRWLQPQGFQSAPPATLGFLPFSNQSGLGDVTAGFKLAAVATESTYLTFQFKSYFPSGDASKGLGTNHYSVEPSLLLFHSFSDRWILEGQIGDWHPVGGSAGVPVANSEGFAGDVFFYGIGPSYKLYQGNHIGIAPVIELFGWHVLGGFQTQPLTGTTDGAASEVSGMNIVNLKAGVRTSIGFHNSVYVGFGQALTHDDWYKHIVRLEYRYSF